MPTRRPRQRQYRTDRVAMLDLIASCSSLGCPEGILRARGFTIEDMVALVRDGLATAIPERIVAGSTKMEVARVKITDAGRKALEGMKR